MKTKVILENQIENAKREYKEFEKQYQRAILLTLLDDKKISKGQYDECKRRLMLK